VRSTFRILALAAVTAFMNWTSGSVQAAPQASPDVNWADSGQADATDRLRSVEPSPSREIRGLVLGRGDSPVSGAVIVSNAGGRAISNARGEFSLVLPQIAGEPRVAAAIRLTAASTQGGTTLVGSSLLTEEAQRGESLIISMASSGTCEPSWLPSFGGQPGVSEFPNSGLATPTVYSLAVFDDGLGDGPCLIIGGDFSIAGGRYASQIARWDGVEWSALGEGCNNVVRALAVHDAGAGPVLFAGGDFTTAGGLPASRIASWNGVSWAPVGGGVDGAVYALTSVTLGSTTTLVAGGLFSTAGGVSASRIASWNGSAWSALSSGVFQGGVGGNYFVASLAVFNEGSGPALIAGGKFATAGGVTASNIARWDGATWSPLGTGTNAEVLALATDAAGGSTLYAGGAFTLAGGAPASRVATWNGSSWSALGSGVNLTVYSLAISPVGGAVAPGLYAGGQFTTAGGTPANRVARWTGTTWEPVTTGVTNTVRCIARIPLGAAGGLSDRLAVGGSFTTAGDSDGASPFSAKGVIAWDGSAWQLLGFGFSARVTAMTTFDDGGGPALYIAGGFRHVNGILVNRIAKWDGTAWSSLGTGFGKPISSLAVYDDGLGGGPALFAGGSFQPSDGSPGKFIAKWDGNSWSEVGGGLNGQVLALEVFDDGLGGGPRLYAGGEFTQAGGSSMSGIARWNGITWSPVGAGMTQSGGNYVAELLAYPGGDLGGPSLFVGGKFSIIGGVFVSNLARWNGSTWSSVGGSLGGGPAGTSTVNALALVESDGSLPGGLYAGGFFSLAGPVSAKNIARWNGTSWSALGTGVGSTVGAICAFDDGAGSGQSLYVGGFFLSAGGISANNLARWDGAAWSDVGGGVNSSVSELKAIQLSPRDAEVLYVGGQFTLSPAGDSYLARWQGCPTVTPCLGDFDGNGTVDGADLATMLGAWGGPGADLDGSGATDGADLAVLLGAWGVCP
jgi:hypothetical protein